ncbi:aminotransferase class IV [Elizabethkingia sp. JS20170427COW]|uniref:aminotransferase class IV n=1 Tax=Elizabethkingia sp. JS20170427COW TaxID=2583851 RepID=UPI0011106DCD|nr:aminotransferase class IV [Elizabethkingia sp. JS20170427COW]QCX53172.1 aminodeoxychorismate lyase [Elizabethkingia sp. JS20170427COW]
MSRYIESIRIEDKKVFLLEYHQKRMDEVFRSDARENPFQLKELFQKLEVDERGLFKWRIVYDTYGFIQSQLIPYAVNICEDFELMDARHVDYHFKFEDRKALDLLKEKANADEVILFKHGNITDTSYSNLIFKKGQQWYTPKYYLLNGVMRQFLLDNNKIKELDIHLKNLGEFSHFQLINAMIPFGTQEYPIEKISNLYQAKTLDI